MGWVRDPFPPHSLSPERPAATAACLPVRSADRSTPAGPNKTTQAVGGNSISLALKAYAAPTALSAAATIPVGYALRTTNGGTVWQNVPLFFTKVRQMASPVPCG